MRDIENTSVLRVNAKQKVINRHPITKLLESLKEAAKCFDIDLLDDRILKELRKQFKEEVESLKKNKPSIVKELPVAVKVKPYKVILKKSKKNKELTEEQVLNTFKNSVNGNENYYNQICDNIRNLDEQERKIDETLSFLVIFENLYVN
jgi:hypothetical protein